MRKATLLTPLAAAFLVALALSRAPGHAVESAPPPVPSANLPRALAQELNKPVAVELRPDQILSPGGSLREVRGTLVDVNEHWLSVETDGSVHKDLTVLHIPMSGISGVFTAP